MNKENMNKEGNMIKGVLFDMDGVLVDNSHMHIKSFDVLYDRFDVPKDERKNVMDFMGRGLEECLANLLPDYVIEKYGFEFLCEEKERVYREIYAPTIKPIDGLVALLKKFKENGVKCAVGSSGCLKNVEFVLDKCDIKQYFEAIVAGDMVTHCKPDPEIYSVAAEKLGLRTSDCIVFEDAMVGIESARKAGVNRVIALTTSYTIAELEKQLPEYIVNDFTEVTDLMLS